MTGIVFISSLASLKLKTGGPPVGFDTIGLLVGVPILSILTGVAASRYDGKRSKVEKLLLMTHLKIEHNKNLDPIASLNLGLTLNGIGLVINF